MANIQFEDYSSRKNSTAQQKEFKVGYFSLKEDNEEAIVRFAYTSPKEFNITSGHKIKVGENYRFISCLRESKLEPITKCPLCASGDEKMAKVYNKFYVKLIHYVKNESGEIVPVAKVWDRPAKFATELANVIADNELVGDISNYVFKIKRHGAKGSIDTTYTITLANSMVYKPEIYVKKLDDFNDFDLAHHSYMIRTAEEITTFLETGAFPKLGGAKTETAEPVAEPAQSFGFTATSTPVASTTPAAPAASTASAPTSTGTGERPRRYTTF